ncbi:MAG TPA: enoyl-CoA hydratase-related protein [Anaerolineales bacterium]|nr:enoyl-CoA hydratase-related protein [Anaerolineales bacterium]
MSQLIQIDIEERVATLTLSNPPVNALTQATLSALAVAVDDVLADHAVRVVVITGAGEKAFVAGADIKAFDAQVSGGEAGLAAMREYLAQGQTLFTTIERAPVPVIAALNGVALGGGLELALACHLRVAAPQARLGQPEINLGLIPAWGGTQRLPRLIGQTRALELILTGEAVTAEQALAIGLVNAVSGDAVEAAQALARKIASKGAAATAAALRAVRAGLALSLADGLALEVSEAERLFETADLREGVRAFVEKRPARFA